MFMAARRLLVRCALLASTLVLALPAAMFAQCPTADQAGRKIRAIYKRQIEVTQVNPTGLKGICEVRVSFEGRPNVIYTDTTGAYLLTGHLFETASAKDLTEETICALSSLSSEDLKKVAALVAMNIGTKGPTVYFVTDPLCPYCKRAGAALKELADKGEIQLRVLLFPLPMHKGAREQCVAVICDNKGFDDLGNGYNSGNQCAEGARLVDETIALLSGKGITGTPTYLFPDGRYQSGVLEGNALRQRLGIAVTAGATAPAPRGTGLPPPPPLE